MKTKIVLFLLAVLICLGCVTCLLNNCSFTEEPETIMLPDVKQDQYVYDQGEFLSEEAENQMNSLLVQLEKQTTIEFAVITIPSLNNLTIEQYAVKLGNTLGIGKAEEDNGVLLLISKEDTKVRLEIGNGLQGILTDSICGRILDNFFVPYREQDKYDDASVNTVHAIINVLADSEEYEFSVDRLNPEIALDNDGLSLKEFLIIIVAIIILLIILEWLTGHFSGGGFGDGIVFAIISSASDSSGSSSFGGGGFSGGGSTR